MNEEIIYNLLILESKNQLSAEERVKIDEYRVTNPDSVESVKKMIALTSDLVFVSNDDVDAAWRNFESKISLDKSNASSPRVHVRRRQLSRGLMAVAAMFFLAAAFFVWNQKDQVYLAQEQSIEQILTDGSELVINKGSNTALNSKFGKHARELKVDGEVFIKAAKSQIPMNVRSEQFDIRVLGTEFNVMDFPEDDIATVTLYEGKISLTMPNGDTHKMNAGEHICYNKANQSISRATTTSAYPSWVDGKLIFDNVLFAEVITRIERQYQVEISGKELLKGLHFNDEVGDSNLQALFHRIELATGYSIENIKDNKFEILKKK